MLHLPCDKDDLHDAITAVPIRPLLIDHAICVLKSNTCIANTYVVHDASKNDELKLLSSLNTLGYIDFDVLCNLSSLEEKLFACADLPWFSRHTYHVIGKYNDKGQYMIHRVYVSSDMNSPFVVQDCDKLEGSRTNNIITCPSSNFVLNKQVYSQEGEHCWLLPSIAALCFVGTNPLQDSNDKHHVFFEHGAYMLAEIFVRADTRQTWKSGYILLQNYLPSLCFRNLVLLCVVQEQF